MENTDAMFNSASRTILAKLEIFFTEDPVVVTKDDVLIDFDMAEQTWSGSTQLFGNIQPNTIDITLANNNRRFSPSNTSGPYYGLIKIGVAIKAYIRASEEADWIFLGTYYVTNWEADNGGLSAYVFASDGLIKVLKQDSSLVLPKQSVSYVDYLTYYCNTLEVPAIIDPSLLGLMQWGFSSGSVVQDLSLLAQANWASCGFNRSEVLSILPFSTPTALRATITDADQIISVNAKQSIVQTYDGVSLTFCVPFVKQDEVLSVDSYEVTAGINEEARLPFSKTPVVYLTDVEVATQSTRTVIRQFRYSPRELYVTLESTGIASTANLKAHGKLLELPAFVMKDDGQNLLNYNNPYIQFGAFATYFKNKLNLYASAKLPVLEVETKGNMLFKLGDKIEVNSAYYATHFIGKIIGMKTRYSGSLSQTIQLLDSTIVED